MKNFFKGKFATVIILLATFILAGVAIFTAIRLYQLRQQPVAPNVPSSKPKAQEVTTCSLTFTINVSSPTGSPTASPTGSPTGSPTATPTGSPSPSGSPNSCNGTCGSNANCQSNYVCYQGFCRNPSCTSNTSCTCPDTPAPTATPGQPELPQSGTDWPTYAGIGLGIFVILASILLAI
jgi:hypothetical protein